MRRAEASGSRGSSTSVSLAARCVGGVHARVGADEAVMGAADQHAALGAQHLGGLVEHHLHRARVLAVRRPRRAAASSRARALGSHARERDDRALGLGHGLVGDRHDLVIATAARGPSAPTISCGQVVAGAQLGEAAEGACAQAATTALAFRQAA